MKILRSILKFIIHKTLTEIVPDLIEKYLKDQPEEKILELISFKGDEK